MIIGVYCGFFARALLKFNLSLFFSLLLLATCPELKVSSKQILISFLDLQNNKVRIAIL